MKQLLSACLVLFGGIAALSAHAAGSLVDVTLVDRDTGRPLPTYYHHGQFWVAGEPGAHYAIYLRNRLGERLLAVTSVDGVNVITGQSAGWDQAGYVLDSWEGYPVTGWRKSDDQVAAFAFTAAPRSYAARTGRSENVGVIGIALFREQRDTTLPTLRAPRIANDGSESARAAPPAAERAQREGQARAPAAAPGASDLAANAIAAAPPRPAPGLGTAHGAREYSYVAHTTFVRRQGRPEEIIRIRYDSLGNLIALGIVRPPRYQGPGPSPFPATDDRSYVPDPPPFDTAQPR